MQTVSFVDMNVMNTFKLSDKREADSFKVVCLYPEFTLVPVYP